MPYPQRCLGYLAIKGVIRPRRLFTAIGKLAVSQLHDNIAQIELAIRAMPSTIAMQPGLELT